LFFFLLLEEDRVTLAHHLPEALAAAPVSVLACGTGCRLVEASSSSPVGDGGCTLAMPKQYLFARQLTEKPKPDYKQVQVKKTIRKRAISKISWFGGLLFGSSWVIGCESSFYQGHYGLAVIFQVRECEFEECLLVQSVLSLNGWKLSMSKIEKLQYQYLSLPLFFLKSIHSIGSS
jgi:hypothetical protein